MGQNKDVLPVDRCRAVNQRRWFQARFYKELEGLGECCTAGRFGAAPPLNAVVFAAWGCRVVGIATGAKVGLRGINRPSVDGDAVGPVDRQYLARFTLGNAALEREVLSLFAEQAPLYLQQLQTAKTSKAWREAAHTLKGSAAAVGARRVASFAELAERIDFEASISFAPDHREQALAVVAAAVAEACGHIEKLFGVEAAGG
jgi:HPt (histidine-containing phosphotransfer) domain-containing protein